MTIFPSIDNARDLGGTRVADGRKVRSRLLLRGGALAKASDRDLAVLRDEYNLAAIFDFRTSMEVQHSPDKQVDGAKYFWMPAFDEDSHSFREQNLPQEAYKHLGEWLVEHASEERPQVFAKKLYADMVENEFTQIQYAGFLQNIVHIDNGAVYWHCSQGKDRTGFGAAMLLAALGADRDAIMEEYCLSADFYKEELAMYIDKVNTQAEKTVIRTFLSVNPDYFAQALDLIDSEYGSMDKYLSGPLCLSEDDITALKDRYLE